ncbi:hypothetical protein Tco_1348041 [Tanacetum coccineum]
MSDQKFVDTHNLVAFLEKPTESEAFEEIVDFLNANPIEYALTVNPTINCSCIKLFRDTIKAKIVNGEVQLQALVDKNKVIITKSTIRRYLQLEDANGVDCLPNAVKVQKYQLIPITHPSFNHQHHNLKRNKFRRKHKKDTEIPHSSGPTEHIADEVANEENVPTQSNNPPLSRVNTLRSGEDRLSLKELMDLYIKLSGRVLDLETTKTAQAKEIASLKKRVKKLERKRKSKTLGMKRLFKIHRSAQVILSKDEGLGVLDEQEVEVKKVVSIAEVTTESATTTTVDELTLARTLIEIKAAKHKVRGVVIQEPREFATTTTTTTLAVSKPSQDKGKAKMIESEEPLKMKPKDQDKVETGYELAQRLQAEEQEELTIEEKSKLFQQLLEKRRVNTFVDIDTELVKGSEIRKEESSSKRAGDELEQEPTKKKKVDDDKER